MSDQWRQLALEVVVTMSETAPATVRKAGKFITLLGWFGYAAVFITVLLCMLSVGRGNYITHCCCLMLTGAVLCPTACTYGIRKLQPVAITRVSVNQYCYQEVAQAGQHLVVVEA